MKFPAPIWMCVMASVVTAAGVSAMLLSPVERRREVHEPPVEQAFRRHIPQSAIARAQIADLSGGPAMESPRIVHRPPRQIDAPAADAGAEPVGYTPPAVARGSARFEAPWPPYSSTIRVQAPRIDLVFWLKKPVGRMSAASSDSGTLR